MNRCGTCGGLWFDMLEAEHAKATKGSELIDSGAPEKGQRMDSKRDIKCPDCKTSMVKMAALGQPHIQYEMCSICGGSFFDAGEFKNFKDLTAGESIRRILSAFRR